MTPSSDGDPRVLLVMNAVLSGLFSYIVVRGFDYLGSVAFSWRNVLFLTLVMMATTFVVTR